MLAAGSSARHIFARLAQQGADKVDDPLIARMARHPRPRRALNAVSPLAAEDREGVLAGYRNLLHEMSVSMLQPASGVLSPLERLPSALDPAVMAAC